MTTLAAFFWVLPAGSAMVALALALAWWWQPAAPADGLRISCSVGVARRLPGESVRNMLRRADVALYQAKAEGRDRVVTAADRMLFDSSLTAGTPPIPPATADRLAATGS